MKSGSGSIVISPAETIDISGTVTSELGYVRGEVLNLSSVSIRAPLGNVFYRWEPIGKLKFLLYSKAFLSKNLKIIGHCGLFQDPFTKILQKKNAGSYTL